MGFNLPLLNRRRRSPGFSPASLLAGSTAFLWLDPSDLTTMFQDAAGTTPVTAPAQPVGLVLDKSQGLVLGPELVTNGDFSSGTTGWTSSAYSLSLSSNALRVSYNGVTFGTFVGVTSLMEQGKAYQMTYEVVDASQASNFSLGVAHGSAPLKKTAGTHTVIWTQVSNTTSISFYVDGIISGESVTIDNISVRELPGFHATQSTAANRPTYGVVPSRGRVNLLTFSEAFDNAAWTAADATTSANFSVAPDGTSTADRLLEAATNAVHSISQTLSSLPATQHVFSVYLKKGTGATAPDWVQVTFGGASTGWANFNLSTGAVGINSSATATISSVGSGWYRCSVTVTIAVAGAASVQVVFTNNTDSATRRPSYAGATTSDVLIWGAQLETGSTASPYQRVASQFEVTDPAGFPSYPLHYLFFGGDLDPRWLQTATIDPAANAVPGPELVTNGDFSNGTTGWTLGTGWSVSGGAAAHASGAEGFLDQTISFATGTSYRVTFTVSGRTTGAVQVFLRGGFTSSITSNGTFSQIVVAGTAALYSFRVVGGSTFDGSIDNISVREVVADKVQVFAGVRKLSDAAAGVVAEFSADVGSNNGTFQLRAPHAATSATYLWQSKGTLFSTFTAATTFTAPITNVLTGLGDISGDIATLRVNGTQVAQSTADQGTGNYLAYPLYIGRRGGTSLAFNGNLYGLIVRFSTANLDAGLLGQTEKWMGGKTPEMAAPTITGVPTIGVA